MVRLDIMELFIADHLLHGAFVLLRYAAVDQLVQNRQHFIPPHGAAFEQDLAHGQNLAVAQAHRLCMRQPVAASSAVLDHVPAAAFHWRGMSAAIPDRAGCCAM